MLIVSHLIAIQIDSFHYPANISYRLAIRIAVQFDVIVSPLEKHFILLKSKINI